ncbi:EamA-like transporter family protein [Tepidamorphus gemmatus]|uniref:EamA-like transporter family protein n=1 Tax=Tepidamorphus gemmatus TaxID=747076 RepID=A0A4R3MAV8_9HYPH|nr:DMT family transporter [Tepidamorphus gemmatus]TCT10640.1 EamA-like transporter family protein [Tepidamorphus gemmatus]
MFGEWLWAVFTVSAAGAQTMRNAMQKELTASLGTVGATHVRFLFGFPFALVFLAIAVVATGAPPALPDAAALAWTAAGAGAQFVATALMLAAMELRSFLVATAYTKTEPVLVLMFAVVVLAEVPTPALIAAVLIATGGVLMMSWPGTTMAGSSLRAAAYGLGSAALFAMSAVCYRGGIQASASPSFIVAASSTLVVALALQAATVTLVLLVRRRGTLAAILGRWRQSMTAGFLGALASQFWFLAFALQGAAAVRTLALVEILFAQMVSRRLFDQRTTRAEAIGILLLVSGVALILAGT